MFGRLTIMKFASAPDFPAAPAVPFLSSLPTVFYVSFFTNLPTRLPAKQPPIERSGK